MRHVGVPTRESRRVLASTRHTYAPVTDTLVCDKNACPRVRGASSIGTVPGFQGGGGGTTEEGASARDKDMYVDGRRRGGEEESERELETKEETLPMSIITRYRLYSVRAGICPYADTDTVQVQCVPRHR
jgi:hypothetical protein